jgi:hypothetical protein
VSTAGTVEADTQNNKVKVTEDKPAYLASTGELALAFPFADSASRLCLFNKNPDADDDARNKAVSLTRIEIQWPARKQRKALLPGENLGLLGPWSVFPSPNGKLVAIGCEITSKKRILVIDAKGTIVADLAVEA